MGDRGIDGCHWPGFGTLFAVAIGICGLALTLLYRRYLGILGANRQVTTERQAYDAVRNSLSGGNLASCAPPCAVANQFP
jgi:hypothetical protein